MNFMKDIRTTITTTEQINRIIDKYEAEQEEADDQESAAPLAVAHLETDCV